MIHYYEIQNCTFAWNAQNQPVLLAPQGYDTDTLTRNMFVLLPDGSWCHYLNEAEYQYLISVPAGQDARFYAGMSGQPALPAEPERSPEQTAKEQKIANILCFSSIGCVAFSLLGLGLKEPAVTGVFLQAAIVLAVIVRVRYKESRFGRVLMLIYLILLAVGVIAFIVLFVILCKIMSDCCSSCQNMPG